MPVSELLTAAEIAAIVHVKQETITKWGSKGVIPRVVINRRVTRYHADEVLEALKNLAGKGGVK
jgi:predicted site-specific integrase-resolvase